jgi:hypothetical protein
VDFVEVLPGTDNTPFVGKQVDICEAFGFEIPKGCEPSPKRKKRAPKKA